jgi:CheY-like chemotaxis protein
MLTVLVADDEPHLRLLVSATLASSGCRLIEAADGDQAWALLRQEKPDVAVLDVMMPGRTGLDLVRLIREDEELKHVRVILLTAKDEAEDARAGRQAGADLYLTKPYSPLTLLNAVTCDFAIGAPDHATSAHQGALHMSEPGPSNGDHTWRPALTVRAEAPPEAPAAPRARASAAAQPRWPGEFVDEGRLWEILGCSDERALADPAVARRVALLEQRLEQASRKGAIKRFVARDAAAGRVVAHGYRRDDVRRLIAHPGAVNEPKPTAR